MRLSRLDYGVLAISHGCSHESQTIRRRLHEDGFGFCSHCKGIKPVEAFVRNSRGLSGRSTRCYSCSRQPVKSRVDYVKCGSNWIANSRRLRLRKADENLHKVS